MGEEIRVVHLEPSAPIKKRHQSAVGKAPQTRPELKKIFQTKEKNCYHNQNTEYLKYYNID